nr:2Fe-2S iron-sulfur cluster-binding protein [uncultured Brevundimonas sp.]
MPSITVTDQSGEKRTIHPASGTSLMEALRNAGFDEILALCGGNCSCATCHVYVDQERLGQFGKPSADEDDLLDSSDYRQSNSRLSCQLLVTEDLNGLSITIPPEG